MPWIHQHTNWPNFTWHAETILPLLAAVRHAQGRLLGSMENLGFDLRREASLSTLSTEVVKSSAIEGEALSLVEVRSSMARRLGLEIAGLVPSSRSVDGIVEMMLDASQHFDAPLTAERLFGWHALLFPNGFSGMHRLSVGTWRPASAGPMQVISGPMGREYIHFEAPAADRLEFEMQTFLRWFQETARGGLDPVLRSAIAHFWVVTIHPFEDGNGRIVRAIADLALAFADRSAERFYSMSAQIEAERKGYYSALESQQRDSPDLTPWLKWFLGCLARALARAEITLDEVRFKDVFWRYGNQFTLNERQKAVLNRMLDGYEGFMRTSKYARMAKCSEDTALRDIRALLKHGLLVTNPAQGRSTSYRLPAKDELESQARDHGV